MQAKEEKVTEVRCIICQRETPEGLMILGRFICNQCERRLVSLDVTDDSYGYYVERLKYIWNRGY